MYYFASDMHLGHGTREESLERERLLVGWLEKVSEDAREIFLVGDVFDFWYEYNRVVPKGFSRLLGTLSRLTDNGVQIHFFPGNHDMWTYDYLEVECGLNIHHEPGLFDLYGRRVFVTHGDDITSRRAGIGARLMNATFRNSAARWLFSHLVHPDAALNFGQRWSSHSRKSKDVAHRFLAEDEPMVKFARQYLSGGEKADYFIFGHNHCAEIYPLDDASKAVFLGEWLENPTYAALSPNGDISLHSVK